MYNRKIAALVLVLAMFVTEPIHVYATNIQNGTVEESEKITPINGEMEETVITVSSDTFLDERQKPEQVAEFQYHLTEEQMTEKQNLSELAGDLLGRTAGEDYREGQIIFEASSVQDAKKIAEGYDAKFLSYEYGVGIANLEQPCTVAEAVAEGAQMDNNLPAVYPDYICELEEGYNDPKYDGKTYLTALDTECPQQYFHGKIMTEAGWNLSDGRGVKVAIIDSGINTQHPNLKPNIVEAKYFGKQLTPEDTNGHGSHVSGLVAAVKSNGISGVAPGADIYSLSVSDDEKGEFALSNAIRATNYAIEKEVDVMNMSFSSSVTVPLFERAIKKAVDRGIVIVVAASNEGYDLNKVPCYPACYKDVITVAATDKNNKLASFSNYGEGKIDVAAPGVNIYSAWIEPERYQAIGGTSMASPIVTGVVAQAIGSGVGTGLEGKEKVKAICDQVCQTAVDIGPSKYFGAGLVNAAGVTKTVGIATKNGKTGLLAGEKLQCVGNISGITWTSSNPEVASIDSTGMITASSVSKNALVRITASKGVQSGSIIVGVYVGRIKRVYIGEGEKEVKKISMVTENVATTLQDDASKTLNIWNNVSRDEAFAYQCTSSNEEVATAEVSGNNLTIKSAGKKGSAYIFVIAQDGSGKGTKIKIEVSNPVKAVIIKNSICTTLNLSQYPIAKGKNVRLLGNTNVDATNKKLIWSCSGNPDVTITKSGTVKCKPGAIVGSTATITATATDGYQASKSVTFTVTEPVQSITLVTGASPEKNRLSLTLTGNSAYPYKDYFRWKINPDSAYGNGPTEYVSVYSSDRRIAYIDGATLNCLKKGTATITIKALDGSGKTARVTVHVK